MVAISSGWANTFLYHLILAKSAPGVVSTGKGSLENPLIGRQTDVRFLIKHIINVTSNFVESGTAVK